jgi:hypothetical protein
VGLDFAIPLIDLGWAGTLGDRTLEGGASHGVQLHAATPVEPAMVPFVSRILR